MPKLSDTVFDEWILANTELTFDEWLLDEGPKFDPPHFGLDARNFMVGGAAFSGIGKAIKKIGKAVGAGAVAVAGAAGPAIPNGKMIAAIGAAIIIEQQMRRRR